MPLDQESPEQRLLYAGYLLATSNYVSGQGEKVRHPA